MAATSPYKRENRIEQVTAPNWSMSKVPPIGKNQFLNSKQIRVKITIMLTVMMPSRIGCSAPLKIKRLTEMYQG
jgi:hypothetical protein